MLRVDARRRCYEKYGARVLGRYSTASSLTPTSITDARVLESTLSNVAQYEAWGGFRPNQAGGNRYTLLGRVTGSTIATSNTFTDALTDKVWELLPPDIDPDLDLNAALVEALRLIYFPMDRPATIWPNGAFDDADVDDFTTSAASGLLLEPTQAQQYNENGLWSMLMTWSTSGVQCKPVTPARFAAGSRVALYASIIPYSGISSSAPLTFDVWNENTNARLAGTSQISLTERVPQVVGGVYTVPAGCDSIGFRIAAASGAIAAVDGLPGHDMAARRLPAASYMDSPHKLLGMATARYAQQLAGDRWAARSRTFDGWNASKDFRPEAPRAEAIEPRVMILRDELPEHDIWFHVLRPWYDKVTWADDQQDCPARDDLILAACYYTVGSMLARKRNTQAFNGVLADARALLDGQFVAEIPTAEPEERSMFVPGGRPGRYSVG